MCSVHACSKFITYFSIYLKGYISSLMSECVSYEYFKGGSNIKHNHIIICHESFFTNSRMALERSIAWDAKRRVLSIFGFYDNNNVSLPGPTLEIIHIKMDLVLMAKSPSYRLDSFFALLLDNRNFLMFQSDDLDVLLPG
ncbi:hypothetical protein ES332_D09G097600v1 [Gossypium tomentosum]|uniref:Uncharacterized protein n=1 Tax=Gossypium tomentosum TaxID=34277 RepID=A0A5D2JG95_GOSTO|nr:hypothetical protein ES332_D09G097600v1 [Gossypium tomentosum]